MRGPRTVASATAHLRARLLIPSLSTSTVMRAGCVPGPLPLRAFDARRPGTPALRVRPDVSPPCECGVREDRRWLGKLIDAAPDDRPAWLRQTRRSRRLVRLRTLLATVPCTQQTSQHATHRRSGSRCLEWCARMQCLPLRTVSKYAGAVRIPRRSRVYLSCGSAMPR